jgi:hypothetical protein
MLTPSKETPKSVSLAVKRPECETEKTGQSYLHSAMAWRLITKQFNFYIDHIFQEALPVKLEAAVIFIAGGQCRKCRGFV